MNLEELKKYCIDNHRKMWNWLADNPYSNKCHWPGWENHNDDIFKKDENKYCHLCGYISCAIDQNCFNCPLDWGIADMCMDKYPKKSCYIRYIEALTLKSKSKYAKEIANLPEKDDIMQG